MDEFSLHQFIIRRGKVLSRTPEFESFKRTNAPHWGAIVNVIRALENLMSLYSVPIAYIDGQSVAELAKEEVVQSSYSLEELMHCVANAEQVGMQSCCCYWFACLLLLLRLISPYLAPLHTFLSSDLISPVRFLILLPHYYAVVVG